MKRFLFIFLVVVISWIIILATFSWLNNNSDESQKEALNKFLSIKNELYVYDSTKKEFSLDNSKKWDFYYQSISPIDWIYYVKWTNSNPISIKEDDKWIKINISTWQYVFVLNDVFQKYEITFWDFRVTQLGKWIFFVNNDVDNYRIYSLNSILDVALNQRNRVVTSFKLFPSLFFKHNSWYSSILKWADILRVSMVDSIYYLDIKNKESASIICSKENWTDNILSIAVDDLNKKLGQYEKLYNFVLKIRFNDIPGYWLISNYQSFFDNQNKKEIYLKSTLVKNFLELVNNNENQGQNYANISTALDELWNMSHDKKQEWIELLKNYYYLAYFWKIVIKNTDDLTNNDNINTNRIIRSILKDTSVSGDYFSVLSDIYFSYTFTKMDMDWLDRFVNVYLSDIKKRKILKDEDFLPFSFFLTQYTLSHTWISEDSVNIIVYLIEMFDNYFSTIQDNRRWFNALWVQFYNFSKIITNVNSWIFKKYFEKTTDGVVLKNEFIKQNGIWVEATNLWENTIDYLWLLYRTWYKDLQNKKPLFDRFLWNIDDKENLKTNFTELEKKYSALLTIISTLSDYNKYIESLKLNSKAKEAKILEFNDSFSLSYEDLYSYLSQFNWVDLTSISLLNASTINEDRYYMVQVNILWKSFSFKLNPDWHVISNVIISSEWNTDNSFSTQAISLDDKKKLFTDRYRAEMDPAKKENLNFANFFNVVFLSNPNDSQSGDDYITDNSQTNSSAQESKFISVFKQDKLIDWDFKSLLKVLPIPFNQINVTVSQNWDYQISLSDIKKAFTYWWNSYTAEVTVDYNFVEKYFYSTKLKIYNTDWWFYEYDWAYVNILPAKIRTQDFPIVIDRLWQYLATLKRVFPQWQWNIEFDLNLWKVLINSQSYDLLNY